MSRERFAVFGDLHLQETSPRFTHTLDVLDQCIDTAIAKYGVRVFVFLGDIFEGKPTPVEYHAFLLRLKDCADRGRVFIVRGNHESYDAYNFFETLMPAVTVAWDDFRVIDLAGARVLLIPYPVRYRPPFHTVDQTSISGSMRASVEVIAQKVQEALAGADRAFSDSGFGRDGLLPVLLLVFGHVTLEGMTTRDTDFERHSANEVVVPLSAFDGAALVKVGHIHRAQQLTPTIGGVGDLVRCSFAEADDPKIFAIITVHDGIVEDEAVPSPCRAMREFSLDLDDLSLRLGEIEAVAEAGAEIKVTVRMDSTDVSRYDVTTFDKIRTLAPLLMLEKDVRPVTRVRAPAMTADMSLVDEFLMWASAADIALDPSRVSRMTIKMQELT